MGSNKEIITLQFGNYSNYVATHYWNLQTYLINNDLKSHDNQFNKNIFFQDIKNENKIISNPRCIISDLDVNLTSKPIEKYHYTEFESFNFEKWTNFWNSNLHPKSIHVIDGFEFNREHNFSYNGQGKESYQIYKEDYDNQMHFFAEDCDNLQGFNIFCDNYNAFGGLQNGFCEDIIFNDFQSKSSLFFSVLPPFNEMNKFDLQLICLNTLISCCQILNNSGFIIPLSVCKSLSNKDFYGQNILNYDPYSQYESSSILASALFNNSLPLELLYKQFTLYDMLYPFSSSQKKIFSLNCLLPFNNKDASLTNLNKLEINSLSASLVDDNLQNHYHTCISGFKEFYFDRNSIYVEQKINFKKPFPPIFKNKNDNKLQFEEHGMFTSLQYSSNECDHFKDILKYSETFKKCDISMLSRFKIEEDEFKNYIEQFNQFITNYNE